MNNVIDFPNRDAIYEIAAGWLVRMDAGGLDEQEIAAFEAWLGQSPGHVSVFRATLATWEGTTSLKALSAYFPLEILGVNKQRNQECRVKRRWPGLIAACVALLGIAIGYAMINAGVYRTGIGERMTIQLPDGSEMTLNTDSKVKVSFADHARRIDLIRGEAFFKVVKDPQRPFMVVGEDSIVTAVGTAFSVYRKNGSVKVVVSEGVVQLQTASPAPGPGEDQGLKTKSGVERRVQAPVYLEEGQIGIFDHAQLNVEVISSQRIEQQLAWREDMLVFDGESLAEVISEFQRYTNTRFMVDGSVEKVRVGGYFRSGDVEGMLSSLESNFGVQVVQLDDDRVLLKHAGKKR